MTENSTQQYQDGPPTGQDMTMFVREVKIGVLQRIGAPAERSDTVESAALAFQSSAQQLVVTRTEPVDARTRRSRAVHEPRKSFVALFAIMAAVVLLCVVGARLLGVDAWQTSGDSPVSMGGPGTSSATPSPLPTGLIDEAAAIQIARMSNPAPSTSGTAPAEARLMTYDGWMTGYGEGVSAAVDPSELVWAVSVNAPTSFPGYGSPGSTIPPSDGYTVLINAHTGMLLEFAARPTVFTPDISTSPPQDRGAGITATEPLQPGQRPLDEAAAISAALAAGGAPAGTKAEAILIPFADWPAKYGGSDFTAVDRDRPVWVVNVDASAKFRFTGPPGSTPPPSTGYAVLIDSYSGDLM